MEKEKFTVYADNESYVYAHKEFNNIDAAHGWASQFVHKYDGEKYRVILHIDNNDEECVDTLENDRMEVWNA